MNYIFDFFKLTKNLKVEIENDEEDEKEETSEEDEEV